MSLTVKQREAVESWQRGDICVLAGPGSGKTRVLVERFRWLVEQKGVDPAGILAITFTEKAAKNMHEELMKPVRDLGLRRRYERAQISTIDALCARLLREHALEAGVDPEFQVIEPWVAEFELRRVISHVLDSMYEADRASAQRFLAAFAAANDLAEDYELTNVHRQIYRLYEGMRIQSGRPFCESADEKQACETLADALTKVARAAGADDLTAAAERLRAMHAAESPDLSLLDETENAFGRLAIPADARLADQIRSTYFPHCRAALLATAFEGPRRWLVEALERTDHEFRAWKRAAGVLDFPDLEEQAVRILESLPTLRTGFQHILVDEFQDTNPLQAKLFQLLRGDPRQAEPVMLAVGDINQAIYGFRHADPRVFHDYREDVRKRNGHVVDLQENFRSRPEILRLVEILLDRAVGIEAHQLTAGREFAPKTVPSIEVLIARAGDSEHAKRREAAHVAARIADLHGTLPVSARKDEPPEPARWKDFAVLLRTHALATAFASELRTAGIPCQLSAGRGFFDLPEVRDLVRLLRVLRNPRDEISLAAVLCSPLAGITDETLLRLKLRPQVEGGVKSMNLAEALADPPLVDAEDAVRLTRLRELIERHRPARDDVPPDILLSRLIAQTGYEAHLLKSDNGPYQVANVRKLVNLLRRLSKGLPIRFLEFMHRLEALESSGIDEPEAATGDESVDAVRVMTLHAAKGLEFPIVVIPSLQSGVRRDSDPTAFHPEKGIGAKWRFPGGGKENERKDPALEASEKQTKQSEAEESHRLFYVAMTRAHEHLILSAFFAHTVRATHWSKLLREKAGIDLKQLDSQPTLHRHLGCEMTVWRTDQDPEVRPSLALSRRAEEALWLDRAPPGEQSDSEASVTSVALFAQCPRKYYLSRYLGFDGGAASGIVGQKTSPGSEDGWPADFDPLDATELGLRVHAILAGSRPPEDSGSETMHLVRNFQESELGRRADSAEQIVREQSLLFPLDGHLLRGQIDLWFDDGERILVDYKTDKLKGNEAEERAGDYALQLQLYALALGGGSGRLPDRAIAYFLRPNVAVSAPLSAGALDQAREAVAAFFEAQSRRDFPLRTGRHCLRCQHYRGLCPAVVAPEEPLVPASAATPKKAPPSQLRLPL